MVLPPKKVAAIHDLSGFGRCALTVIIPTLSSMSIQVCPVPTAVLSTHTGDFQGFSFHDFTEFLPEYIEHWKRLNLKFDAVYSGFLGSHEQIEIVASFIDSFKQNGALTLVDPVMGDDGLIYSTYTPQMCRHMKSLIKKADVITPNVTEAALLLDEPYRVNLDPKTAKSWLRRLSDMGPGICVITGALDGGRVVNFGFDRENNEFWAADCCLLKIQYPGTGDIFASVLLGSLLTGEPLPNAMSLATQFVEKCISITSHHQTPIREGVMLECALHLLYGGLDDSKFKGV